MSVPDVSNEIWKDIVTGKKKVEFEFLAVKVFMGKVKMMLRNDNSKTDELAKELHDLFESNARLAAAKRDLEKLKQRLE